MLAGLFRNHVLANLSFALVLIIGSISYLLLPRQQDPTINFNWIDVTTVWPGAAAEDVEKRVTDILEEGIRKVQDIDFVQSTSKDSLSNILVRFNELSEREFDKRLNDLRREVQNKESELPELAEDPDIFEITSSNAFPSATVAVTGRANDENLRRQAENVLKDLERLDGVDRVLETGLHDPEIQILLHPERLQALGLSPTDLADSVSLYFRDVAAGRGEVAERSWLVRLVGKQPEPGYLASLPILTAEGEVPLGSLADVVRAREEATHRVSYEGRPAVMFGITKQPNTNTLELVERINAYIAERNRLASGTGVELVLIDDQTEVTRSALRVMQTNAALGLLMVLLVAWVFLGLRIATLTAIGIPFILAGTFWIVGALGQTLNVMVLLGAVISLGMLVDDAVVVVESIYDRLRRGVDNLTATLEALREVAAPVTSAVLTTMAAFLPLMLLPGILGDYMMVVPLVVTIALAISLVEAFWMLPTHVMALRVRFDRRSRAYAARTRLLLKIRTRYTRLLIRAMRHPRKILGGALALFLLALVAASAGQIQPRLLDTPMVERLLVRTEFFAFDPVRLFYVNVEMPVGTPLERTLDKTLEIERSLRAGLRAGEVREILTYAGQMYTETAPLQGEHYGQVMISLRPKSEDLRSVSQMVADLRGSLAQISGPVRVYFYELKGGPPTSKPVNVKVRGDDLDEIRAGVAALKTFMAADGRYRDVTDNDVPGVDELVLRLNTDAVRRAGLSPLTVLRTANMLVDGEVVAELQDQGEEVEVRVRARPGPWQDIGEILRHELVTDDGEPIALSELVGTVTQPGLGNVRHYNFRRAITVEAEIDKSRMDTVQANRLLQEHWTELGPRFPNLDLDFSGELDDIQESLGAMLQLMLLGVLLMYLILGTQFRSYFQPFLILATVPMAFTGVVVGLLITANPLSLYTLYGVVALAGIAVNSAIVLISAANQRLQAGMSVLHATIYAARRRVIPILITSLTTVAGLFSLATGLGGKSLLWGPVATAIVWGLTVSTTLTLFVVPLLYRQFMRRKALQRTPIQA
jgi:multidrug efflux pump subunit AcrB